MKNTLLSSAFIALLSTQIYADQTVTPAQPTPADTPAVAPEANPAPHTEPATNPTLQVEPAAPATNQAPQVEPSTPASNSAPQPEAAPTVNPAPQTEPAAPTANPAPQAEPAAPTATPESQVTIQPAAQNVMPVTVINCDYKIPADTKKMDPTLITTWAERAVVQSFTFDPNVLDTQMQKLQACFTEQGWSGFNTALQKSGNIEAIKSQKLMVSSQVDGQSIIAENKDNQWKLTIPVAVTYQNEKEKVNQLLSVDVTVSRKPNGDLGIIQMIAAPRGSVNTNAPQEPAAATPAENKPQ